MKTPKTFNEIFQSERNSIVVPSRTEFRGILERVTKNTTERNIRENTTISLFGSSRQLSKKTMLVFATVLIIVIIIIPKKLFVGTVSRGTEYVPTHNTSQVATTVSTEMDEIIADIMNDINAENMLLEQELAVEQVIADDSDILDTSLIS